MSTEKSFTRKSPTDRDTFQPDVPIRSADQAWEEWERGVRFGGRHIPLSVLGGSEQVGFHLEELPPGKQSCPFHFHLLEEEHFFILSGRCILRSGENRREMGPGDYVCFPAGRRVAHCFENPFEDPCRYIAVGTRDPREIAVYPDSKKMKLRALDALVPFASPESSLDYWEGEHPETPIEAADR